MFKYRVTTMWFASYEMPHLFPETRTNYVDEIMKREVRENHLQKRYVRFHNAP